MQQYCANDSETDRTALSSQASAGDCLETRRQSKALWIAASSSTLAWMVLSFARSVRRHTVAVSICVLAFFI